MNNTLEIVFYIFILSIIALIVIVCALMWALGAVENENKILRDALCELEDEDGDSSDRNEGRM